MNVTGTTVYAPRLIGERLRILKRIVPNLDKSRWPSTAIMSQRTQFELLHSEAQKLASKSSPLDIRRPEDVDAAFDNALAFGAKALVKCRRHLYQFSAGSRLQPARRNTNCHSFTATSNTCRRVGLWHLVQVITRVTTMLPNYVDKILRGANPADLPIAGTDPVHHERQSYGAQQLDLSLPSEPLIPSG